MVMVKMVKETVPEPTGPRLEAPVQSMVWVCGISDDFMGLS